MSGNFLRSTLPLLACLLLFTQCDVIRYLTTEPDGTTATTRNGGKTSSGSSPRTRTTTTTRPTTTTPSNTGKSTKVSDREARLRQDIVVYAKEQLGTKYKYAGRSPRTGFDCSGFTHYVMDNFDVDLSPSSRAQENQGKKIKISEAKSGDLIFFRRSKNGAVFHVAMVVSNDRDGLKVIHSTSRGVVIDNISVSKYWSPKISTARDVL
ncbi:C40 family peptidase [Flavilitoribacter nigricans]|uniref:NlpC/P60 domain-containing protein n=1 Tax=Flavilitoribacter nigricans (strain ATCC 23147 / DSM 23189 / NBRC 102662 / NCIMB 1420 / SS-2) TaxID=1122177 RepID=A0A2D0MXK0_FLAN2|nr:C40 family peptidase [Flavilitoribacter nigricans]PHN01001.1 hypothetical protein CRP01_39375 [Flavilitoribacter nigricans DSM 23189 = NBRC 102662]